MTVTREYLPGLRLAQQFIAESVSEEAASDLNVLIAQASAAPEQEAVEALVLADCVEHRHPGYGGGYFGTDVVMLYTHADPSEVERLRAELAESDKCVVRALNERDEALQQLSDAQALLRDWLEGSGSVVAMDMRTAAFLSATAQPADGVKSHE